jgi:Protein of unknown function (DUF3667)
MSGEFEAGGALVTAGLAARLLDGQDGHGAPTGPCQNCGTILTGKFCAACGQAGHVHRTLSHLVEEAVHGILHFDGRFWRTLPQLVFRPGSLTRDYMVGRRARFVSPLASFLFTIFLMFFVFSLTGGPKIVSGGSPDEAKALEIDIEAEIDEAKAELVKEGVFKDQAEADAALTADLGLVIAAAEKIDNRPWQDQWRKAVEKGNIHVDTGRPEQNAKIKKKLMNPDLLLYKLSNTAYKFSFLLVPLSLPFLALMFFWKRGVTLFDHGVFVLYSLTFMSLLFVVIVLLGMIAGNMFDGVVPFLVLSPPVHMFFQLKGAYALSWFSALWRSVLLVISSLTCMALFAGAVLSLIILT